MVSTRGYKFKFNIGERVLCYEPDLTKAKVLYDSKVMEIIEAKDKKGKKIIEYLIHFQGWNSSWDRRVNEDFVLKDTDEHRQLQKDLADKSQLQIGAYLYRKDRKKRNRLMSGSSSGGNGGPESKRRFRCGSSEEGSSCSTATIIGTRDDTDEVQLMPAAAGNCGDTFDAMSAHHHSPLPVSMTHHHVAVAAGTDGGGGGGGDIDTESYSSSVESTIEDDRVALQIGDKLKTILELDYTLITNGNKLVNLPAAVPVITILENFVKHFSIKSLTTTTQSDAPRRRNSNVAKCERREKDYEKLANSISLRKEIADGLRLYFDFTLKDYLLYRQELEQASVLLSEENLSNFKYKAAEQQPLDLFCVKQETPAAPFGSDATESQTSGGAPTSSETHEDNSRRRLRSHKNEESEVLFDIGLNPTKDTYCISSVASTSSGGSTPHATIGTTSNTAPSLSGTNTTTNINILKSLLPSNIGVTSKTKEILENLFVWQLLPSESPTEPSMIYGAIHLARLIVKLPDFLNATTISDDKLKLLLHHLDTFIEYLEMHAEWFSELIYTDATAANPIKVDGAPTDNKENVAVVAGNLPSDIIADTSLEKSC